ncbi:MAG: thermonuclease family protein [Pseudomonadota bacterium]
MVVSSITDGDTFRIVDGDTSVPVRVRGLDSPELRRYGRGRPVPLCETALADQARAYAVQMLTRDGAVVTMRVTGADRFGRLLAWVWVDGERLDKLMINAGHGRAYTGGQRTGGWC